MKKTAFILYWVLWESLTMGLFAQPMAKDSLKARLAQYARVDTQYIEDLYQLAYQHSKSGTDTMLQIGQRVIQLSDSLGHPAGIAKGYRVLCSWYRDALDFEKGEECCKRAIALCDSLGMKLLKAKALNTLATVYESQYPDSALIYTLETLDIFRELGDKHWEAISLQFLGNLYRNIGNYDKSIESHEAALEIYRIHDSAIKDGVPGQLINLATVYKVRAETRSDSVTIKQDLEKARENLEEALKTFQNIGLPFGEMVAALNLGQVYLLEKDFLLALSAYDRCLEINKRIGHNGVEVIGRWGKIAIMKRMGQFQESKKQALALLNDSGLPIDDQSLKDIYSTLHEASYEMKQFEDAYVFLLKKIELEKQFEWNSQLKTQLEDLGHQHEATILENQVALLAEENRKASIYKYGSIGLTLALLALAIVWLVQALEKRKQQQQIQFEKEARLQIEQNLAKEKLRRSEWEKQQLAADIQLKNQALSSQALQLARKNQWLENLYQQISQESSLQTLKKEVKAGLDQDRNWEEMRGFFEDLHPEFMPKLKRQYPALSKSDLRLAALYKMKLSREEMLHFLAIAPESFKMARYRLRKKLGLSSEEEVVELIQMI